MQDQSTNSLIDPLGEPTLQLLSLVILGKAMPYLHNGIMVVDCDDDFAVRQRNHLVTAAGMCASISPILHSSVVTSYSSLDELNFLNFTSI